jgi:hypothetical protein
MRRVRYESRGGSEFPTKIPKTNHVLFEAHKDYYKANYLDKCDNLDLMADLSKSRRTAMFRSADKRNM